MALKEEEEYLGEGDMMMMKAMERKCLKRGLNSCLHIPINVFSTSALFLFMIVLLRPVHDTFLSL